MTLLKVSPSGVMLGGSESSKAPPQIIGLNLDMRYVEQILEHVMRKGKSEPVQLCLGEEPRIAFGDMTQRLIPSYDPFSNEIFISPYDNQTNANMPPQLKRVGHASWGFKGKAGPLRTDRQEKIQKDKSVVVKPISKVTEKRDPVTAGTDDALAALQATMKDVSDKKSANTTKIVKGLAMNNKKGGKKGFLGPSSSFAGGSTKGSPAGSPSLTGLGSPRHPPTSAPQSASEQQAERAKAVRAPIIHVLAAEPSTESRLRRLKKDAWTEAEFQAAIDKVADKKDDVYILVQKSYRELDVYKYPYQDDETRQRAIQNAVKVYDKMRLETSAPEWERLLPKEERGTGKCLSKVQAAIAAGTAKAPKINIQRPSDNAASGAESGADDLKSEAMVRTSSQSSATKSKRPTEKEAQAKRLMGKGGVTKAGPKSTSKKASAKAEERVLSSQYVEDSDDEADTVLDASPNPSPAKSITKDASKSAAKSPAPKSSAAGHKRNTSSANSSSGSSDAPIAKKWMSAKKASKKAAEKDESDLPTAATVVKALSTPNHVQGGRASPMPQNPVMHKRKSSEEDSEKSPVPSKKARTEQISAPSASTANKRMPSPQSSPQKTASHRVSDASSKSSSSNGSSSTMRPRSSTQKSSPLAMSPPTNASDLSEHETDSERNYMSSSSTDKSAASRLQLSATRRIKQPDKVMDTARKFKSYYASYHKDYLALEKMTTVERDSVEGKEMYERMIEMHERLAALKREVYAGYAK